MFENIPIVAGNRKRSGSIIGLPGETSENAVTDSFTIVDNSGKGICVLFDSLQTLRVCRSGMEFYYYGDSVVINRVEIPLPAKLSLGQEFALHYRIVPSNIRAVSLPEKKGKAQNRVLLQHNGHDLIVKINSIEKSDIRVALFTMQGRIAAFKSLANSNPGIHVLPLNEHTFRHTPMILQVSINGKVMLRRMCITSM
jgi:hypothetical protein